MEQSPSWRADSSSASQDIHHILCKQKVHYHINNTLLRVAAETCSWTL
jgi:hypothetical protein